MENLAQRHPEVTLANDSPEARDRILRIPRIFLNYTPENGEKQQRKQRKRAEPEVSQTKRKARVGTRNNFGNQLKIKKLRFFETTPTFCRVIGQQGMK